MLYVVICDSKYDQVCESKAQADKEKADLLKLGCGVVKILACASWQEVEKAEIKYS